MKRIFMFRYHRLSSPRVARVIPVSRACTCLRGNNSNDCVQRSPASPNPCISDTLSPLSALCRSILYISPRAQAPHTNTNNNGYTHVPPVLTHRTSRVSRNLSDPIQRNFIFNFQSWRRRGLRLLGGAMTGCSAADIACDQSEGILFWQPGHYSDIFLWRPERVKMCPWGAQMFSAPFHLYHVSWIRFKWFSIEIFIHNSPHLVRFEICREIAIIGR